MAETRFDAANKVYWKDYKPLIVCDEQGEFFDLDCDRSTLLEMYRNRLDDLPKWAWGVRALPRPITEAQTEAALASLIQPDTEADAGLREAFTGYEELEAAVRKAVADFNGLRVPDMVKPYWYEVDYSTVVLLDGFWPQEAVDA